MKDIKNLSKIKENYQIVIEIAEKMKIKAKTHLIVIAMNQVLNILMILKKAIIQKN